ncbi:unnamed protein product [Brachionus calyciflorus]|uniref:BED-type domain-containing protein n=1 Tax=Brachionus calyciflorus TaxID=104777 RepID=A0A813V6A7_9BILA|nr:unnamed protein product [Brachionus calyciflorus]
MIGRGIQKKTKASQPSIPKQHPQVLSNFNYDKSVIERPWENFTATCKHCEKTVRGSIKVTTNFSNHMKDKCVIVTKSTTLKNNNNQKNLNAFFQSEPQKWNKNSKTQQECEDLVVSTFALCLLPLRILDMAPFKKLIQTFNPQFNHVSRTVATRRILPNLIKVTKEKLLALLQKCESACLLLDLWTDRRHRTYIGINCHVIDPDWESKTVLLYCRRFKGAHLSETINEIFNSACVEFGLSDKLHTIITDNAANMYAAFDEVALSGFNANFDEILKKYESSIDNVVDKMSTMVASDNDVIMDEEDEDENQSDFEEDDDSESFQHGRAVSETNMILITEEIDFSCNRLPCCAHSLQLVIKDGLSSSTNLTNMITKISKIVNKIHKTPTFVEILEELKLTVSSANITR